MPLLRLLRHAAQTQPLSPLSADDSRLRVGKELGRLGRVLDGPTKLHVRRQGKLHKEKRNTAHRPRGGGGGAVCLWACGHECVPRNKGRCGDQTGAPKECTKCRRSGFIAASPCTGTRRRRPAVAHTAPNHGCHLLCLLACPQILTTSSCMSDPAIATFDLDLCPSLLAASQRLQGGAGLVTAACEPACAETIYAVSSAGTAARPMGATRPHGCAPSATDCSTSRAAVVDHRLGPPTSFR